MQWIDPDKTPIILQPAEEHTPSLPVPLTRRKLSSWEPPPLRQLLESVPPPPPVPTRPDLDCALSTRPPPSTPPWSIDTPAFATTSTLAIDWDTTYDFHKPKRAYLGWMAVGAAYTMGITTMVLFEQERVAKLASTSAADPVEESFDLPLLSKAAPLAEATIVTADEVVLKEPLHIVGFVTDPQPVPMHEPNFERVEPKRHGIWPSPHAAPKAEPKPEPPPEAKPREIDLARLRVIVGAKARQASGCGAGKTSGSTRVAVTFAPSGRATSAVLAGGKFNGTAVGSCIASVMRSAVIPPFDGPHTTVSKTVKVRK